MKKRISRNKLLWIGAASFSLSAAASAIPSEKYGFSNHVRHALRPASFEDASFRLKDNKEPILISLK